MNRYWVLLWLAGLCEIGWVSGLKHASNAGEWILTAVGILLSFFGLIYATRVLPVGTAYAVFTGIGAAGTVLAESIFFNIHLDAGKLALVIVMVIGIAGLKMSTTTEKREVEK
ncbi:DMT family transporter [Cohnella silvisoli]|uniref:Multidrug efflux SMR transporter n=1 Tax=Cohnella silvisoli TaxID=2873699 RepID=A0ABV1KPH5_9BACL|nr:multidrug efflux SMR transporter [Cohnella silvisoli]MCD9022347.1 multidrug efflux SMR transporter [Cohnella silvisoli]